MKPNEYFSQFQSALNDEIAATRKNKGQKTYLNDGSYLGARDGRFIYSFTADTELKFPDDASADLEYGDTRTKVTIVSIDGFDVVVALDKHIDGSIATAILYTEPWFLLEALQQRLIELRNLPDRAERALKVLNGQHKANKPDLNLVKNLLKVTRRQLGNKLWNRLNPNQFQQNAIGHILSNDVSFVWGPPGTGKTRTLGLAVAALVNNGKSVLVVAHSNVAVDVAMLSVADSLFKSKLYHDGKVLRYGVSYRPEVDDEYPKLNVRGVLKQQNPALVNQIENLERQRAKLTKQTRGANLSAVEKKRIQDELNKIKKELEPLHAEIKTIEKRMVQTASVVGCTLSKATISDTIFGRIFDAVFIDEASMAYVPHCVFASSLARHHTAIFGDFRQLAPISLGDTSSTRSWLSRDIFDRAGVIDTVNAGKTDPRMVLLAMQYRMHPDIAAIPNDLFYRGLLENGPNVIPDNTPIAAYRPNPGQALVLYDLSQVSAHCFSDKVSYSRFNLISGLMAVQLAYAIVETNQNHKIGIVTPYNAQSRLISRLLRDLKITQNQVYVATVHRFQGSENDIIIFDTVEGPPKQKPGLLVIGGEDSTAMRLANVAISRAKGKFISLVNLDYIQYRLSSKDSFRILIDQVQEKNTPFAASWTNPDKIEFPGATYYPNGQAARNDITQEIHSATEEIAIFWSHVIQPQYHFSTTALAKRNFNQVRLYIRGAGGGQFDSLKNARIWSDRSRLPIGIVGIDRQRLWIYVEPEKPNGPVFRLELANTTKLLYSFWQLVPDGANQQTPTQKAKAGKGPVGTPCPKCGNPMMPEKGPYGPYMQCVVCNATKRMTTKDATDYAILMQDSCQYCGGQAVGRKGANGVFLGCANYPTCKWTKDIP